MADDKFEQKKKADKEDRESAKASAFLAVIVLVILVIIAVVEIRGRMKTQELEDKIKEAEVTTIDNDLFETIYTGNINGLEYVIFYDKDTKVEYLFSSGHLDPLYNSDGSLKLFTE